MGPEPGVFSFSGRVCRTGDPGGDPSARLPGVRVRVCAPAPSSPPPVQACTVCKSSFGGCCSGEQRRGGRSPSGIAACACVCGGDQDAT